MSSTITAYIVHIDQLQQAIGSSDAALIDTIVQTQSDFLDSIDDIDDESELTCAEALAELINGSVSENGGAFDPRGLGLLPFIESSFCL